MEKQKNTNATAAAPPLCPFMSRSHVIFQPPAPAGRILDPVVAAAQQPQPIQIFAPVACQGAACALWHALGFSEGECSLSQASSIASALVDLTDAIEGKG